MEIIEWLKLHWQDIILWAMQVIGAVAFIINTLKVRGTRNALTLNFKAREKSIMDSNSKLVTDANRKIEQAERLLKQAEENMAAAQQLVESERYRMAQEREYLQAFYKAQMQRYKESILEITQADTTLVAKGVAEKVAKRFSEEEER